MGSMRNVGLRKAVNAWAAAVNERNYKRQMALNAVGRMQDIVLARGFTSWLDLHEAHKVTGRNSRFLNLIATRLLKSSGARYGFAVWQHTCRAARAHAEALRVQRLAFRRRIQRSLYTWLRNGSNAKVDLVCQKLAQTEADLEEARRAAKVMEAEAMELRRMLVDRNDGRHTNLQLEAEATHLRKALSETRALNKQLEDRAGHFDEQYRRLWRATHDPTYVSSTQYVEKGFQMVPDSKTRVEELQQQRQQEDRTLSNFQPSSDDLLNIKAVPGEPALRCSRSSVVSVSTFSSRQMRTPVTHDKSISPMGPRGRSPPGMAAELTRLSDQWPATLRTPQARSPALHAATGRTATPRY